MFRVSWLLLPVKSSSTCSDLVLNGHAKSNRSCLLLIRVRLVQIYSDLASIWFVTLRSGLETSKSSSIASIGESQASRLHFWARLLSDWARWSWIPPLWFRLCSIDTTGTSLVFDCVQFLQYSWKSGPVVTQYFRSEFKWCSSMSQLSSTLILWLICDSVSHLSLVPALCLSCLNTVTQCTIRLVRFFSFWSQIMANRGRDRRWSRDYEPYVGEEAEFNQLERNMKCIKTKGITWKRWVGKLPN